MSLDFTFDNGATAIGDVSLPFQVSGLFFVDWGDGVTDNGLTHTYTATSATAKVTLAGGTFTGFGRYNWSGVAVLTSVANNAGDDNWGWGTGAISLQSAFYNATKLTSVPSTIPVGTSSMAEMFSGASVFNQDISSWNTSNVNDMQFMFYFATAFDQNIRNWDTLNVTTYSNMFIGAQAMISTYTGVTGFGNTPTSAFFNFTPTLDFTFDNGATAIGDVSLPFQGSGTFSVDWGDGVTGTSLTHTYSATSATAKVQLTGGTITGVGRYNWSGVQLLTKLENNTGDDNFGLGTGAITLDYAFYNASKLTSVPSTIPVGTNNMNAMFISASAFNGDISSWNTSKVTSMGEMFKSASAFNGDISGWNTSNVTDMQFMFYFATAFDQNIRGWDTLSGPVSTYSNMFTGAQAMISTYTGVTGFGETPNSDFFNFTPTLDFTFDNGATAIGDVSLPFQGSGTFSVDWGDGVSDNGLTHTYTATSATAKVTLAGGTVTGFGRYNWSGVAVLTSVANNAGDDNWGWGTGAISLQSAFYDATKLTSVPSTIPVGTSSMAEMFSEASVFNQDISSWNTSNVTDMQFMFYFATAFDQNIRGWDTLSGPVSTYSNMFIGAQAMISTYTGVTGFGNTPTSAFFNFTPTLDFTFDNGATAIGAVSLPYQGSGTFSVDWGDGVTDTSLAHTYSRQQPLPPRLQLTGGTITGFGAQNWSGAAFLTELADNTQDDNWGWGTGAITLEYAFYNASKLTSVPSTIPVGTSSMDLCL